MKNIQPLSDRKCTVDFKIDKVMNAWFSLAAWVKSALYIDKIRKTNKTIKIYSKIFY